MDQFFVSFLLLEGFAITGFALFLVVVGGVVASQIFKVKVAMRRVAYLWFVALAGLALSLSQFVWVLTPAAADAGLLSALVVGGLGSFALFGAGIYYGSAARSIHIQGNTRHAWLGFVPFANLWLMFAAAEDKLANPPSQSRFSRSVSDPILVVGALLVLGVSQLIDRALEEAPLYSSSDSQALSELVAKSQTLEESFATEARLSSEALPVEIDSITTLVSVTSEGRTLRIIYDVSDEIPALNEEFKASLASMQCAPEMFGFDIMRGGTVEMIYRGPGGRVIDTIVITAAECGA